MTTNNHADADQIEEAVANVQFYARQIVAELDGLHIDAQVEAMVRLGCTDPDDADALTTRLTRTYEG